MDAVLALQVLSASEAYVLQNVISLVGTYTFSIWHRSERDSKITFNVLGEVETVPSSTDWKKYVKTVTISDLEDAEINLIPEENVFSFFYEGYLVEGTKDTAWTPAPEDVFSEIERQGIGNWCYNNDLTYINGGRIYTGSITAAQIAANAIISEKIAANAITAEKILAGAIDTDKLAANAVTAVKIATGAVTANAIEAGAITADKISANAITSKAIDAGAITTDKIAAKAITTDKIAAGAVTATEIAANSITADKIDVDDLFAQNITASGTISGVTIKGADIEADEFGVKDKISFYSNVIDKKTPIMKIESEFYEDIIDGVGDFSCYLSELQIGPGKDADTNGKVIGEHNGYPVQFNNVRIMNDTIVDGDISFKDNSGETIFCSWMANEITELNRNLDSYDYVIDEGSNTDWSWRKWKNGLFECWRSSNSTVSMSFTSSYGNLYYKSVEAWATWGTAAQFVSIEDIQTTCMSSTGLLSSSVTGATISNKAVQLNFYVSSSNQLSNVPVNLKVCIRGRWK